MDILKKFAATDSSTESGIFETLGIDFPTLIFQLIAFLLLVAALAKWVFPILIKTVDAREETIRAGADAANEAKERAEKAEAEVDKLMKKARTEASAVVASAKKEASDIVDQAEAKAKQRTEVLLKNAEEQLQKDVLAVKKELHNETLELVALATEKVLSKTASGKVDGEFIESSVKELQK
jgi:F-type H+-transporting ATPase subunit b